MLTKFKTRRLEKKMQSLLDIALSRRDENNKYKPFYDFLNISEQEEYSKLAYRHYQLTGSHIWFNPKHFQDMEENSPLGMLTVSGSPTIVEFKYDEEVNGYHMLENGKKTKFYPVPVDTLFPWRKND